MSTVSNRPGRAVVSVRDAAVHFGGVKAIDGLTFDVTAGLISGIIGPNGSGKSTLLGALSRYVDLTAGSISIGGADHRGVPPQGVARLGIARTFQTVRLLPDLTVRQNITLGADLHRSRGKSREANEAVDDAIGRTHLEEAASRYPGDLSYGTQRRVEIARALAMRPTLLVLDEPTAGMNQAERAEIGGLLRELRDEGLTQLLVEHDVQMMLDTCEHLIAMNFGKLITEGKPTDVVRHPGVQEAYLGRKGREHA